MIANSVSRSVLASTSGGDSGSLSNAASRSSAMGRDQFLQMLVTQLKNQDPMSPLQPHEFAAQLAQFSTVEQLQQIGDGLVAQTTALELSNVIGKTTLSAAMLGRSVIAHGNQLEVTANSSPPIKVDIGGVGGTTTLIVRDSKGKEVARREFGSMPGGSQTLALPEGLVPGVYKYEVQVKDGAGKTIPVTPYVTGTVSGVSFRDGSIVLRIGGMEVVLDDVAEIGTPTTTP
ncbi:MAG: hypothetical protein HOP12_15725 [Candidatus Eisenbacteria bacterium]|uniref:Basal-body rod modification protein FlgD n=1 Tax=Eiseniibacteriota bacterium TaxID=2212470 RepID=A0A849SSE9_UNCEI|nr:hypothetical protein [Candidatus Eisenbacteria bacterium]